MRNLQNVEKKRYGDIRFNFILAHERFLFEGSGFDRGQSLNGLKILFMGNFTQKAPPSTLMRVFKSLLDYAVDLGKLIKNYKLYSERQQNLRTPSVPGDELHAILQKAPFEKHFDFNVTRPEPCIIACL